jgi:hypothetical protein
MGWTPDKESKHCLEGQRNRVEASMPLAVVGVPHFVIIGAGSRRAAARWRGPARLGTGPRVILDPNRNVDPAFRATLLALREGRVITGLARREEGTNLILADRNGKEATIPSGDVEDRRLPRLSPIPADIGAVIAEGDL